MYYWMKRVLSTAALAGGLLMVTAGAANATGLEVPTLDPIDTISQIQQAINNNETNQAADASAETNQTNVYAPIAVLSPGANSGDVDQSNEADTSAEAENENSTDQGVQQDQAVDAGSDCSCGGSDSDVDQSQDASNNNSTDQDADANAETNQTNVYAPVAVLSPGANSGDVDQSNEADTSAEAENENSTGQWIQQDQMVEGSDGDGWYGKHCGCDKTDDGDVQSQDASNNNSTVQDADAAAITDQSNTVDGDRPDTQKNWGAKGFHHRYDRGDVDQSNEADTSAEAENENSTGQWIRQIQSVGLAW